MEPRTLTPAERAQFAAQHDLSDIRDCAVPLVAFVCGVAVEDAEAMYENAEVSPAQWTQLLHECWEAFMADNTKQRTDELSAKHHLSAVMRVCEHYRISLSQFADWSQQDQELALAYFIESRDTCPGCGLGKRLRTELLTLSSEQCVHCQELSNARSRMPADIRDYTHLTVRSSHD